MFHSNPLLSLSLALPLITATVITPENIGSLRTDYDYVIIGGGASGLTVANRLTENDNSKSNNQNSLINSNTLKSMFLF